MAKKKGKEYEFDPELAKPGKRSIPQQGPPHIAKGPLEVRHLTNWAQRSALGLRPGQRTPKEADAS